LCLQIRVFDRQWQNFLIQLAVLGELLLEGAEEPEFVGVLKRLQKWPQLCEVAFDRLRGIASLACGRG
jgi:hypothetical protein